MKSGLSLWTYLEFFYIVWHSALLSKLFAYGIQGQLHTWRTDFRLLLSPMCGFQRNPFISPPCQGSSTPGQCSGPSLIPDPLKLSLWLSGKSPLCICWWLYPWLRHPSTFRQTGSSLFPLLRPWQNHKLVKHLEYLFESSQISISISISVSVSFSKPSHLLLKQSSWRSSVTNSWVFPSAVIFLGQTTFQIWLPKPVAVWASSFIQSPSLAHLNYPPTWPSSTAW